MAAVAKKSKPDPFLFAGQYNINAEIAKVMDSLPQQSRRKIFENVIERDQRWESTAAAFRRQTNALNEEKSDQSALLGRVHEAGRHGGHLADENQVATIERALAQIEASRTKNMADHEAHIASREKTSDDIKAFFHKNRGPFEEETPVKLTGGDLPKQQKAVLKKMAATIDQIEKTKRARRPVGDAIAKATAAVEKLAKQSTPAVSLLSRNIEDEAGRFVQGDIRWPMHFINGRDKPDPHAILFWACKDQIIAKLTDLIKADAATRPDSKPISEPDRKALIAKLQAEYLALERELVAIVEAMREAGDTVVRLPRNISALAFLGIRPITF